MTPILFFFNDTATTEIYTLSLHDALPIWMHRPGSSCSATDAGGRHRKYLSEQEISVLTMSDRKSTRLNSSHPSISYAVFCLKKKKPLKITDAGIIIVDCGVLIVLNRVSTP